MNANLRKLVCKTTAAAAGLSLAAVLTANVALAQAAPTHLPATGAVPQTANAYITELDALRSLDQAQPATASSPTVKSIADRIAVMAASRIAPDAATFATELSRLDAMAAAQSGLPTANAYATELDALRALAQAQSANTATISVVKPLAYQPAASRASSATADASNFSDELSRLDAMATWGARPTANDYITQLDYLRSLSTR